MSKSGDGKNLDEIELYIPVRDSQYTLTRTQAEYSLNRIAETPDHSLKYFNVNVSFLCSAECFAKAMMKIENIDLRVAPIAPIELLGNAMQRIKTVRIRLL